MHQEHSLKGSHFEKPPPFLAAILRIRSCIAGRGAEGLEEGGRDNRLAANPGRFADGFKATVHALTWRE